MFRILMLLQSKTLLFCVLLQAVFAHADKTVFTNLGPGEPNAYGAQVIRIALEKTRSEFGDFELLSAPAMSEKRALKSMKENAYSRPIRVFGLTRETINEPATRHIPFPVFLGIYSYRICWVTQDKESDFSKSTNHDQLRQFSYGQLSHWRDYWILKHNGFNVVEGADLASLYRMINAKRIDILCRAPSEPFAEKVLHDGMNNLVLDENIVFFYPQPHFLHVRADDTETAERLYAGLKIAYEDGSLKAAWSRHYRENVDQSKLDSRKVFVLENPGMDGISRSYESFLYQPLSVRNDVSKQIH